jgi:hypothetical protein
MPVGRNRVDDMLLTVAQGLPFCGGTALHEARDAQMASGVNTNSKQDGSLIVDKRNEFSARCTWTIPDVKGKVKQKAVWSKYFDVGGYDCRLLVYPGGMICLN